MKEKTKWKIWGAFLIAASLYFSHSIVWNIAWNKAKAEPCSKQQCLQHLITYEDEAYNKLIMRLFGKEVVK